MNAQKNKIITFLQEITLNKGDRGENTLSIESIHWLQQTRLGSALNEIYPTDELPPKLNKQLKADALTTKFWFQTQYQATLEFVAELNKINITPTLLKGLSISTEFYPKAYYRNMRDIDIIIEADELEQAEKIMLDLGYEQISHLPHTFYESHHHTIPWQHKTKEIWFEIHTGLFPQSSACHSSEAFSLDVIHKEKKQYSLENRKIYRLSHELQIIYIAAHWGESFKQVGGLFAFIDIALIINNSQLNWNKLIQWSSDSNVANYVYVILSYLLKNKLINDSITQQNLENIKHSLSFIELFLLHRFIDNYLLIGKPWGRILTIDNMVILWDILFSTRPLYKKLFLIPFNIIFPPKSKKKFDVRFQLSRIQNLLFKSSE